MYKSLFLYTHKIVQSSLLIPEHFITLNRNILLPIPWQQVINFVFADLPILAISYTWNHTICGFCVRLLSLSMFLRFLHDAAESVLTSFWLNNVSLCGYHILFSPSLVDGYLGCFLFGYYA